MLSHAVYLFAGFLLVGGFALLYSMRNKKLKWGIVLALVCIVVAYMAVSCGPKVGERPFRQSVENISSVTIRTGNIYNRETGEYEIIKELSESEYIELIRDLQSLEIGYSYYTMFLDPSGEFLEIHYLDGEIEQVTSRNNFWITADGNDHHGGYYFEDQTVFDEFLNRYE